MSGNTIMIVAPECSRNETPNPILDQNDWVSYDHSDANAHRVWSIMLGKGVPNMRIGAAAQPQETSRCFFEGSEKNGECRSKSTFR